MSVDESVLAQIEEVRTTDDIEQVNLGLSKGWVILRITENVSVWDDGGKTSYVIYHMGRPKRLPI